MKDWKDNKKMHDDYWGKLYNHVTSNKSKYTDVTSEWNDLFGFEVGYKNNFSYILDAKRVTGSDFNKYVSDKNEYLQKRLDKHVTPTTDAVIDLGAGWGRHSIHLASKNPHYKVITGELSDSGRKVTDYFKNKYDLNIDTFSFNWQDHQSLIDLLSPRDYKEIVVFTSNTIEQITELDIQVFIDLLDLPIEKVSVIHIEPVKFQYDNKPFPFDNYYNRNLRLVLETLKGMGKIEMGDIIPQYWTHNVAPTGQNNILIEWKKRL